MGIPHYFPKRVGRRQFLAQTGQAVLATSTLSRFALAGRAAMGETLPVNFLSYPMHDDWVGNWLVAGPLLTSIPDAYKNDPGGRESLFAEQARAEPGFNGPLDGPFVEGDTFSVGGSQLTWRNFACRDDHQLDFTGWFMRPSYAAVWAYVEIESEVAHDVQGELFSQGHADVWQQGKHIHHSDAFNLSDLQRSNFSMRIEAGVNPLLLRFATVSVNNTEWSQALRLNGLSAAGAQVRVPVHTADVAQRQKLELAFEQAYMNRDLFHSGEEIGLWVPLLTGDARAVQIALSEIGTTGVGTTGEAGTVLRRAVWETGKKADFVSLGKADGLPSRRLLEVTLECAGVRRAIPIEIAENPFALTPRAGTTTESRRKELLEFVIEGARRKKLETAGGVFMWNTSHLCAEIAKMELGRWQEVSEETWVAYADGVTRRQDGSEFRLIELLGALARWGKNPQFPAAAAAAIKHAAVGYRYWLDEPGQTSAYYTSENHMFGYHTSEILAGQLWPDEMFTNNNQNGRWHRQHGEQLALEWLRQRCTYGFDEWDADGYLPMDAEVLAHLSEQAQTPDIQRLSHALLDKMHFTIALQSYKGCFGTTRGRTKVEQMKNAGNEPISCLAYLGWGLAGINAEGADLAVAIVCAGYKPPAVIEAIAFDHPEAIWDREQQGLVNNKSTGEKSGTVNKVTFKTPDYMLGSAQSFQPGQGGHQENIWEATFGPDAVVFGNQPACISESTDRRPNFWVGNRTIPRVAQWKDALLSVHQMRETDWLDFTHVWFPTFAFDEYTVQGNWAFARKGNGYLALTAAHGLSLIARGDTSHRELRSTGRQNVWFCQMGRAAQDGAFAEFKRKVLALQVKFGDLSATLTTLRNETLEFRWDGPLRVNGKETPISGFKQFENPYCTAEWPAREMKIQCGGKTLTMDFS